MDLLEAQRSLEDLAYAAAKARLAAETHEAIKAGDGAGVPAVAQVIKGSLLACSGAIIEWTLDEARKGRRRLAHDIITELDPDVLAYIALTTCYGVALGVKTVTTAAVLCGRHVAVEWLAKVAVQVDPAFVKRLVKNGTRLRGLPGCAKVLAEVLKKHGADPLDWGQEVHIALGEPLVAAAMNLGTFHIADTPEGAILRLTQDAADALALAEATTIWVRPRLLPMVVLPQGWTDPERAPYLTEACQKYQRAYGRTRGKSRAVLRKRWNSEAMKPFREALDALGAAAFQVDPEIVEAVEWAYVSGAKAKKLPSIAEVVVPDLPETEDQDVLRAARAERRDAEDLRLLNRTLGAGLRGDLENLRLLACYPAVYQPHFCDFRGRLNVVSTLSHHRQDFIRACFRFAKAEPLGEHGRKWLAIHLANCASGAHGKLDKAPFAERVAWAEGNKDLIAKVAEDYRANVDLWADADAPFAFIQAAREWTRMLAWEEEHGTHESFPSSIVVSMDG